MAAEIETSAPNLDEIRGGLGCFRMLMRDLEAPDILREEVTRFAYIGECANRRIEIGRIMREVAAPIRARLLADTRALADAHLTPKPLDPTAESQWCRDALEDALAAIAQNHIRQRTEFKQLVELESAKMQATDAARLRRILRDVANGLGHVGIEHGESMRSARAEVLDLVTDSAGDLSGLGWLLLGWLCLWNSAYCADAVSHFSQGLMVVGESRSHLSHLLHRFLGMALEASGRHGEALESAKAALAIRSTPDVLLEASRYAIQSGRGAEAKAFFDSAVRQEPMLLFITLADPDMTALELFIVGEFASAGTRMRQTALRSIEEWQAMIDRVHASERSLGEMMELPFEIADGIDDMRALALKSELIEAMGIHSSARRNTAELYSFALRRLNNAAGQRDAEAAAARSHVQETLAKRDNVTRNAESQAEHVIVHTEAELRRAVGGAGAAPALGAGIGGSLVMLVAFTVAAGVMGPKGIDTGFDSPFGMAGLCLIAAPVILGLSASATSGLKQVTMSSEIERRATYAREKTKATLVEVEQSYTRQAEAGKKAAAALEERARAAGEALKVLRQGPQPSLTLQEGRSASKQAA